MSVLLVAGAAAIVACAPSSESSTTSSSSLAITTTTTTAASTTTSAATNVPAGTEIVVLGGVVITMDEAAPTAEAIAIDGGTIVAVGDRAEIEGLAGASTRVVDLGGRTVLPGFIDAHGHWIGDWGFRYGSPEEAIDTAVANGWTTIAELFASEANLGMYMELDGAGALPIDVAAYLPINYGRERFGDWYLGYAPGTQLSPHVRIAGVKVFVDSGDYGEKLLSEPYADDPDHVGTGFWSREELGDSVMDATAAGFQIAAHTGGDAALDLILDAYEMALDGAPNELRHRVEHVMIARDDQIERMAALGVVASVQLSWFHSDWADEFSSTLGPDRVGWVGRWRDLLDAGVPTIGSTDQPYGYGTVGSSMRAIYQAVTRVGESGAAVPEWMLDQRISVDEALRLITAEAAWGLGEEATKGSITVGKQADLVVLSADPTTVDPAALESIAIVATVIDGTAAYCAEQVEGLCGE